MSSAPMEGRRNKLATIAKVVPAIVIFRNFNTRFNPPAYLSRSQSRKRSNQYLRPLSSITVDKNLEDSIGTSNTATINEATREKDTVKPSGINKSDAI